MYVGKTIAEHLLSTEGASVEELGGRFVEECQLMSELRHQNLTVFMGICFVPKYKLPLLVMEKLDGSLDDLLETVPGIPLSLKRSILEDVARGLLYLHKHKPRLVHRDLTAKNILLTSSFVAKITDYRNSHIVNVQPDFSTSSTTLVYLAPDVLCDTPVFCPSDDVFSFGHLILFTITQV